MNFEHQPTEPTAKPLEGDVLAPAEGKFLEVLGEELTKTIMSLEDEPRAWYLGIEPEVIKQTLLLEDPEADISKTHPNTLRAVYERLQEVVRQ